MTRILPFALSALAFAASTVASAQESSSNVTLYGVADAYVQTLNGASTLTRVQSGGLNTSRFGLRGSEDLGGGLRAIFQIESGIDLDTGSSNQKGQKAFWGRQAWVGLQSSTFGQISLGRQYGSVYHLTADFSEFSNNPVGASSAVIGGFGGYELVRGGTATATGDGGPVRNNNSIKYETPNVGGFKAGALVGLGEVSGGANKTRVTDIYGRYTAGPLDVMLSHVDDRSAAGDLSVGTTSGAAAYSFGDFRVTGGAMSVNDRTAKNVDGRGYWVGGDYLFGDVHTVKAQYVVSTLKEGDGKTKAFGVGYQYDLSKRTALYSSLTRFENEGANYENRWAAEAPSGLFSATDRNLTEFVAGVRHTF